jgi:hypothetical protein
MYRTPPDFGIWITHISQRGHPNDRDRYRERAARGERDRGDSRTPDLEHRHLDGGASPAADAVTPGEPGVPRLRADVGRTWKRAVLIGRHVC